MSAGLAIASLTSTTVASDDVLPLSSLPGSPTRSRLACQRTAYSSPDPFQSSPRAAGLVEQGRAKRLAFAAGRSDVVPIKPAEQSNGSAGTLQKARPVIDLSLDSSPCDFGQGLQSVAQATTPRANRSRYASISPEGSPLSAKPWKKYRSSPPVVADGASIVKNAVSASAARPPIIGESESVVARPTEEYLTEQLDRPAVSTVPFSAESPNIQPAIPRRIDWTPAKVAPATILHDSSDIEEENAHTEPSSVFGGLQAKYGHPEATTVGASAGVDSQIIALGKRKALDLVVMDQSVSRDEDPASRLQARIKAPKKKARTLTELAMAPFAPAEGSEVSEPSVLSFLVPEANRDTLPETSSSKDPKRRKATKSRREDPIQRRPVLLSPESALRQSAAQDFVFGTSSQLVVEKSPSFLKDLHAAMSISNSVDEDPLADNEVISHTLASMRQCSAKRLWAESARDYDGKTAMPDVVNLVSSPTFPEDNLYLDPSKDLAEQSERHKLYLQASTTERDEQVLNNDDPGVCAGDVAVDTRPALAYLPTTLLQQDIEPVQHEDLAIPPPSNQEQSQSIAPQASPVRKVRGGTKPKYELMTDLQLTKHVSSFGFKPVKQRTAKIALLNQCWASKQVGTDAISVPLTDIMARTVSTSSPAKSPVKSRATKGAATPLPLAAKKPRGRPKKAAADNEATKVTSTKSSEPIKRQRGRPKKMNSAPALVAEEPVTPKRHNGRGRAATDIADSPADHASICSPASAIQSVFSSPGVGDVSFNETETEISLITSSLTQGSDASAFITKAVTTAPRSLDVQNPSWHERMLMYDPIILESFAAWLNSGELTRVGYDGEVPPEDVKKWCEARSICCLWRVNIHGKERKRF